MNNNQPMWINKQGVSVDSNQRNYTNKYKLLKLWEWMTAIEEKAEMENITYFIIL